MKTLKEQILELREKGLSYSEIQNELGCTKSTICYHLTDKEKLRVRKNSIEYKLNKPFHNKLSNFTSKSKKGFSNKITKFIQDNDVRKGLKLHRELNNDMNYQEVYEIISQNSICYLTGEYIDLSKPATYQLDHILPISRGGSSLLENMGLTISAANRAKGNMTNQEFFNLCASVIAHNDLLDLVYSKLNIEQSN